ncbi:MAG: sodium:proton antiporter [Rhodothermales bacterium]
MPQFARLASYARAAFVLALLALSWTMVADPSLALEVPAEAATVTVAEATPAVTPTPAPTPKAGGEVPPLWLVIPFVVILLMIATGPIFYPHHWHHHYPKYAVALGVLVGAYYVAIDHTWEPILHAMLEYSAFIALVGSLFIAASGIYVKVNAKGTAGANVVMLFLSSVIANLIATTGAAMLFIRAYMRLNEGRLKPYHIVFFIFLVANVGGALTPIGDPPLFLGFLRGVPFFWTLVNVWYIWLPTTIILLGIFYVIDSRNKAVAPDPKPGAPLIELEGKKNLIWVALIIICVFIDPNVFSFVPNFYELYHIPFGIREVLMLGIAFAAYKTTPKAILTKNEFTMEPIREVGFLFLGIFLTMQPALATIADLASQHADSLTVGMFYWGTGILSGVLDNAPTYLNFVAAAMGKFGLDVNSVQSVVEFSELHPEFLQAISVAAVFFGAMSYIGNAPNFMVKSIAEANGVEVPSFGGYIIRYSLPILMPVYAVVWLIWYSGWIL